MSRRLYVLMAFSISLLGSFIGFVMVFSGFEKPIIFNPNAMPMLLILLAGNVLVNIVAWVWAYAWWMEKEKKDIENV